MGLLRTIQSVQRYNRLVILTPGWTFVKHLHSSTKTHIEFIPARLSQANHKPMSHRKPLFSPDAADGVRIVTVAGRTYRVPAPPEHVYTVDNRSSNSVDASQETTTVKALEVETFFPPGGPRSTIGDRNAHVPSIDDALQIKEIPPENGKDVTFEATFPSIPNVLLKPKGRHPVKPGQITAATGVSIVFKGDAETGESYPILRGPDKTSITTAWQLLTQQTEDVKDSLGYTHFVSLPLCLTPDENKGASVPTHNTNTDANNDPKVTPPLSMSSALRSKVTQFQEQALSLQCQGVDPSIFMPVGRIHVTVCMLKILSKKELSQAVTALQSAQSGVYDAVGSATLMIRLSGLGIMQNDPAKTNVLYGVPVDGTPLGQAVGSRGSISGRIDNVCEVVIEALCKGGVLAQKEINKQRLINNTTGKCTVKLHATLMNSKYRKPMKQEGNTTINNNNNNNNNKNNNSNSNMTDSIDGQGQEEEDVRDGEGIGGEEGQEGSGEKMVDGQGIAEEKMKGEAKEMTSVNTNTQQGGGRGGRGGGGGGSDRRGLKGPFDARAILQQLGKFEFGCVRVPSIQISRMGEGEGLPSRDTTKLNEYEKSYYYCDGKIVLP